MVNMDLNDIEGFKKLVENFMKHHNLRGMEVLIPYHEQKLGFRICGKGMVHPKGTPLEGVDLWEGMNHFLNSEDKAAEY